MELLLKLNVALAKVRVEFRLEDSVSRRLDLDNSSKPPLGINSSSLLSLVNSRGKHLHSGSNLRIIIRLNQFLAGNLQIKPIKFLADKL